MDLDLLKLIFLDAHVVDVDLSEWDKFVRLLVVATELPPDARNRLPVFVVEFVGVSDLHVTFGHLDPPEGYVKMIPDGHYQWRSHNFVLQQERGRHRVTIWGSEQFPNVNLVCRDIDIRSVDLDDLDRTFPGWGDPGGPLIRPGVEAAIRTRVHRQSKRALS